MHFIENFEYQMFAPLCIIDFTFESEILLQANGLVKNPSVSDSNKVSNKGSKLLKKKKSFLLFDKKK